MQKRTLCRGMVLGAAVVLAGVASASAQSTEVRKRVKFERNQETEMALSAAPEHLRAGAGVYLLEEKGYVLARPSSNGFNCFVQQVMVVTAPTCFDAEGSRTIMKVGLRRAELEASGLPAAEVSQAIDADFAAGRLSAPKRPGVAYMLSRDFHRHDPATGNVSTVFAPHVMFYAPFLKNADIGSPKEHFNSEDHVYVLNEGTASAMMIVVPRNQPPARPTR